mmetsp:Transcript_20181/g.35902  ORF Transcript_20181/g.35902 Transcript_20181/m.35902 type:complete len:91 (-) Transcript_20181:20-292(-)
MPPPTPYQISSSRFPQPPFPSLPTQVLDMWLQKRCRNLNWIAATTAATTMAATSMAITTTTEAKKGRATAFALCQGRTATATTTAYRIVR